MALGQARPPPLVTTLRPCTAVVAASSLSTAAVQMAAAALASLHSSQAALASLYHSRRSPSPPQAAPPHASLFLQPWCSPASPRLSALLPPRSPCQPSRLAPVGAGPSQGGSASSVAAAPASAVCWPPTAAGALGAHPSTGASPSMAGGHVRQPSHWDRDSWAPSSGSCGSSPTSTSAASLPGLVAAAAPGSSALAPASQQHMSGTGEGMAVTMDSAPSDMRAGSLPGAEESTSTLHPKPASRWAGVQPPIIARALSSHVTPRNLH